MIRMIKFGILIFLLQSFCILMAQDFKPLKISVRKFDELMTRYHGKKSVLSPTSDIEVYELSDGKLLVRHYFDSTAFLFDSREMFEKVFTVVDGDSGEHILGAFQKEITQMPSSISTNLEAFAQKVCITLPKNLPNVPLKEVEKKLNRYISSNGSEDIFFETVIFIGEYIRQEVHGEWCVIESSEEKNLKELFIRTSDGRMLNMWLPLAKRINEGHKIILRTLIENIISMPSLSVIKPE